jgi:hypothetical protein
MRMRQLFRVSSALVLLVLLHAPINGALAQSSADSAGVRRALLDYIEGFYEGDTSKLVRSVRPDVYKLGFFRPRDSTRYAAAEPMTWKEILDYARGVRARNQPAPATAPKGVLLLEVLDQTASGKVTAWWGTDYILAGKFDGRWMITHVLWQSPGPRTTAAVKTP